MAAGTITLTNNSTAVTGTGTAFASDLSDNDFVVSVVGGVTYTLGVKSVESDTALTLTTAYNGPSTSDAAWSAVANQTLVGITAQVAADVAKAIRGLNLDKANWQQFYSADGNITVNLPDNTSVGGPSWPAMQQTISNGINGRAASGANSDITSLTGLTTALSIEQGGTGKTSAADAIIALGGLPVSGGTMKGVLDWISAAILQTSLGNSGFTAIDTNGSQASITINTSIGTFTIKFGSTVVTANVAGEGTISYSSAFTTRADTVMIMNGDNGHNTSDGTIYGINFNQSRTAGFDYHAVNRANAMMRINFIAIGR
ncbi:hypothetical protein LU604_11005 [Erwinia tracheiphila]|uniref:hypothetical protein n=1 Tax=Erwinia tracheiphila TaxID=65700 RepID=UPI001F1B7233|nr:hypothetical protein [Erwinia tracheiphila]UIA85303.1 hypothetical protein LU604_11005 [Erwinia tracheiphila]